jgi:hypothetical protein
MKRLPKPDMKAEEVYVSCVSGVVTDAAKAHFQACAKDLLELSQQYDAWAASNELHLFRSSLRGNRKQVAAGGLTKGELTDLCTNHMVKQGQRARTYYDRLMLLAPHGKCPLCGFGQASTLDHFLSKALYPSFSVLPNNLVPCCSDCNRKKESTKLTIDNQIPHPYFESAIIENEVWLNVSLKETTPTTAMYFVNVPIGWSDAMAVRVRNYFHGLNLASRFSVEAASEIISLSDFLAQLGTDQHIGNYLERMAKTERALHKNTWKAALYEALAGSIWYRSGGWHR